MNSNDVLHVRELLREIKRLKWQRDCLIIGLAAVIALLFLATISRADTLKLRGRVDPDPLTVTALRFANKGHAFIHVADTAPSRSWFSVSCPDDTLRWHTGQLLIATLKDGSEVRSLEVVAVTPEGEMIRLGLSRVALTDEVRRQPTRGGPVCAVLFAAFRFGLDPDSVVSVRRSP